MNTCEVAVSISKRRVDLDGFRVALKCLVDTAHFFEGISHVAIGVCESRVDTDGLTVVTQSFRQLTLKTLSNNPALN